MIMVVMRIWLFALAACSTPQPEPECNSVLVAASTNVPGTIGSGTELVAATWDRQFGPSAPEHHGIMVFADGTRGTEVSVEGKLATGTPGKDTILWGPPQLAQAVFRLMLHKRDGDVLHFDFAGMTRSRSVVFDGTRYHVFWMASGIAYVNAVYHRTLDEDGTLGPVHELRAPHGPPVPINAAVQAASDRAGTLFVQVVADLYFFDPNTGALTRVFDVDEVGFVDNRSVFYFAGEFHLHQYDNSAPRLISCTPTGCTSRALTNGLSSAENFYPARSTMYVDTTGGLYQVDTSFAVVDSWLPDTRPMGVLGSELVRLDHRPSNPSVAEAGTIHVVGDTFDIELATDALTEIEECDMLSTAR